MSQQTRQSFAIVERFEILEKDVGLAKKSGGTELNLCASYKNLIHIEDNLNHLLVVFFEWFYLELN